MEEDLPAKDPEEAAGSTKMALRRSRRAWLASVLVRVLPLQLSCILTCHGQLVAQESPRAVGSGVMPRSMRLHLPPHPRANITQTAFGVCRGQAALVQLGAAGTDSPPAASLCVVSSRQGQRRLFVCPAVPPPFARSSPESVGTFSGPDRANLTAPPMCACVRLRVRVCIWFGVLVGFHRVATAQARSWS